MDKKEMIIKLADSRETIECRRSLKGVYIDEMGWDISYHKNIIGLTVSNGELKDDYDPYSFWVVCTGGNDIIGGCRVNFGFKTQVQSYIMLNDLEKHYEFNRLFIRKEWRGLGISSMIMLYGLSIIRKTHIDDCVPRLYLTTQNAPYFYHIFWSKLCVFKFLESESNFSELWILNLNEIANLHKYLYKKTKSGKRNCDVSLFI